MPSQPSPPGCWCHLSHAHGNACRWAVRAHTARQFLISALTSPPPHLTHWISERTKTNPRSNPMGEGTPFPASLQERRGRTSALTSQVSIRPTCPVWDTVALSPCLWLLSSTSQTFPQAETGKTQVLQTGCRGNRKSSITERQRKQQFMLRAQQRTIAQLARQGNIGQSSLLQPSPRR